MMWLLRGRRRLRRWRFSCRCMAPNAPFCHFAGIVVGALCASAAVLAAAALFQRRRRARARHPGERTEQGGDLEAGKSLDSPSPRPSSHQQSGCRRLDSSRSDEISGAGFPVDLVRHGEGAAVDSQALLAMCMSCVPFAPGSAAGPSCT